MQKLRYRKCSHFPRSNAEDAVRDMDKRDVDGARIRVVKEAGPVISISITNFSPRTSDRDWEDIFDKYGRVASVSHVPILPGPFITH